MFIRLKNVSQSLLSYVNCILFSGNQEQNCKGIQHEINSMEKELPQAEGYICWANRWFHKFQGVDFSRRDPVKPFKQINTGK